jgi:hypothetical protein
MLTCVCLPLAEIGLNTPLRLLIRDELTKPDSDFHKAVDTKTDGQDGALVRRQRHPV